MNQYDTSVSVCKQVVVHTASEMGLNFKVEDITVVDTECGTFIWLMKFNPSPRLDEKLQPVYDKHGAPIIDYKYTMWAEGMDDIVYETLPDGHFVATMPKMRVVVMYPQLVLIVNKDYSITGTGRLMWTWRWFNDNPFHILKKIMIGASRFKEKFGMNPDYVFINVSVNCNVRFIGSYGLTILRSDLIQINEFGYSLEGWM